MKNYADMDFYYEIYGGDVVPQTELEKWLTLASNRVRLNILGRDITGFEKQVGDATCSVADILYNQSIKNKSLLSDGNISSEKVGDYSRTFTNTSTNEYKRTVDKQIKETLELYLACTDLMYRGL